MIVLNWYGYRGEGTDCSEQFRPHKKENMGFHNFTMLKIKVNK